MTIHLDGGGKGELWYCSGGGAELCYGKGVAS